MQHLNIVVIALRRRAAASKHHGGEGNAEHYKGIGVSVLRHEIADEGGVVEQKGVRSPSHLL